jgi:GH25 family lysozyme M1 (1,4-beta-N-acetylmuramidase)
MTIYGWDASDFDWGRGPMDLAAARADGIDFFTHKATESTNTQHIHYGEVMNRARAAGVPFLGAYHVVRTGDIMAQVTYFLAYVNAQTPWWSSFPGWFFQGDLEKWSYDAVAASMGPAFCAEVERRTGKRCVLYAPKWAYGDSIGGSAPLWASAYGSNPAGPYRNAYPGGASPSWGAYSGRTPAILQFGSRATIGRQPTCDINAFRGTVSDFAQLIHGEAGLGGGVPIQGADDVTPEQDAKLDLIIKQTATANSGVTVAGQQQEHNAILNTLTLAGHLSDALAAVQATEASQASTLTAIKTAVAATTSGPVDVPSLAAAITTNLGTDLAHELITALAAKLGA